VLRSLQLVMCEQLLHGKLHWYCNCFSMSSYFETKNKGMYIIISFV
jgi:hypothetical protein